MNTPPSIRESLFIDGAWRLATGANTLTAIDPATEDILGEVASASVEDVDRAVSAARGAFSAWSQRSGADRARYLRALAAHMHEHAEAFAVLAARNNGKPLVEARIDIGDAIATYKYYATLAEQLDARQNAPVELGDADFTAITRFEPMGVVALIIPWNFPFVTTAWKLAAALAAGCTVVLKPSEISPLIELELGRIAQAIGLPSGVLNIVSGAGEVGSALNNHPDIDKVSFTGSNRVGEQIMVCAAGHIRNISLELGGKSPIIVFEDADIENAVEYIIAGIFFNCGQMCSATSRMLVQKKIAHKLIDELKKRTEKIKIGNSLTEGVEMGPLASAKQLKTVLNYLKTAQSEGLTLLTGGKKPLNFQRGYFIEPTIFVDVPITSVLWREEIFGPVLCIRRFDSEEEAIALANDSEFGLVAGVITSDDARAERVATALQAGYIWINSEQVVFPETSWGGFKRSSIGRELGPWGLDAYLEIKHVIKSKAATNG